MRRILIIAASVIVLLGAGLAVYYYFASTPGLVVAPTGSTTLPGSVVANSVAPVDISTGSEAPATTRVTERLVKISAGPIVPGEVALNIPAVGASSTADVNIQYIERQSGNIFSYLVRAGKNTRISNRTLPGIEEAAWLPTGERAFVRYLSGDTLSNIETYGLAADGSSGFFLSQGLSDMSVSPTGVLALASGASGSVASLIHTDGTRASTVFTSPLSLLRVAFGGKNQYIAFTKPARSLSGSLFLVDSTGHFSRLAGPLLGLVALPSHSGKAVLMSYADGSGMHLDLVDVATRAVTALPVTTIADKCAWAADDSSVYCGIPVAPSADYSYPDDWYQGAVHFSDRLWKIDVVGRYAQLLLDFPAVRVGPLDAQAITLDSEQTVLVFINKNDGSLWSYQL